MKDKIIHRFLYLTPGEKHNVLMWPFLLITAVLGIALTFFDESVSVQSSVLYKLTLAHAPDMVVSIWGVTALLLTIGIIIGIVARKALIGEITTWVGVLLWLYATLLYAAYGFWLQVFTAGVPSLIFWIWYFFYVRDYHNKHKPPP